MGEQEGNTRTHTHTHTHMHTPHTCTHHTHTRTHTHTPSPSGRGSYGRTHGCVRRFSTRARRKQQPPPTPAVHTAARLVTAVFTAETASLQKMYGTHARSHLPLVTWMLSLCTTQAHTHTHAREQGTLTGPVTQRSCVCASAAMRLTSNFSTVASSLVRCHTRSSPSWPGTRSESTTTANPSER